VAVEPTSPDMSAKFAPLAEGNTSDQPTDVGLAVQRLRKKHAPLTQQFNYYDGDQPVVYATDQLTDYFKSLTGRFIENWCAPVIDAVLERIKLRGFDLADGNEAAEELLEELIEAGGLELDAKDAHSAAVIAGEGIIIATPDEDDASEVEVYANDPRQVEVFYDPRHPKRLRMAAKEFCDESTGYHYLTLYYSDRLEHYRSRQDKRPARGKDYVPLPAHEGLAVEPHEWGRVPVFHFRRNRRRIAGELKGRVLSQQDMVNKLLADMMVSSEFAGFRQRYAITNADLSDLESGATELWRIPAGGEDDGPTSVGQFEATDLSNFMSARTGLAEGMAIISHTPKHYMTGASTPSGEALMAMDSPLTKKVDDYLALFGATWREFAVFYCALKGVPLLAKDVTPTWAPATINQPETTSNVVRNLTAAGMPLDTALREEDGWTPKQLDRMNEDRSSAAAAAPPTFGEIALKAAGQRLNGAPYPEPVTGATQEPIADAGGNGHSARPQSPFGR
jgi:hypothetical protein